MIQLYAKMSDLSPTEYREMPTPNLKDAQRAHWLSEWTRWLELITKDGVIKDQMRVQPNGYVIDGNIRWEAASKNNWSHVPIDLRYMLGFMFYRRTAGGQLYFTLRPELRSWFSKPLGALRPVERPVQGALKFNIKKELITDSWKCDE